MVVLTSPGEVPHADERAKCVHPAGEHRMRREPTPLPPPDEDPGIPVDDTELPTDVGIIPPPLRDVRREAPTVVPLLPEVPVEVEVRFVMVDRLRDQRNSSDLPELLVEIPILRTGQRGVEPPDVHERIFPNEPDAVNDRAIVEAPLEAPHAAPE